MPSVLEATWVPLLELLEAGLVTKHSLHLGCPTGSRAECCPMPCSWQDLFCPACALRCPTQPRLTCNPAPACALLLPCCSIRTMINPFSPVSAALILQAGGCGSSYQGERQLCVVPFSRAPGGFCRKGTGRDDGPGLLGPTCLLSDTCKIWDKICSTGRPGLKS